MTFAIVFDSVGAGEWLVLLAVLLIVMGPKRLPSTARKFGQYYSKFRRAAEGFKRQLLEMDTEINNAVTEAENAAEKEMQDVNEAFGTPSAEDAPPEDYASSYHPEEYGMPPESETAPDPAPASEPRADAEAAPKAEA